MYHRSYSPWRYIQFPLYGALAGLILAFGWATLLLGDWAETPSSLIFCLTITIPIGLLLAGLRWLADGDRSTALEKTGDILAGLMAAIIIGAILSLVIGYMAGSYSPEVVEKWGGAPQGDVVLINPDYAWEIISWLGPFLIPVSALIGVIWAARGKAGKVTDCFFN